MVFGSINLKTLPRPLKPKKDEILSSWMVRLALAHNMKVHTFYSIVFPKIGIWNRDIDKSCTDKIIELLSVLTATDMPRVQQTLLKSYEGKLYLNHNPNGNTKWILSAGVYHRTRKHFAQQFCPSCLSKDGDSPYFRKSWRLSFVVCCDDCGIELCDRCQECGKPIAFFRSGIGKKDTDFFNPLYICQDCGFDLRNSAKIKSSLTMLRSQRMLIRILAEGWKSDVIYPHLFFDPFRTILNILTSTDHRSVLLRNFFNRNWPNLLYSEHYISHKNMFEGLPINVRRIIVYEGCWIMQEWPNRFLGIMKHFGIRSMLLTRDMPNIPFWYESIVKDNLFLSNTNRRFKDLLETRFTDSRNSTNRLQLVSLTRQAADRLPLCPSCYSDSFIKFGIQREKQFYRCNWCMRKFTLMPANTYSVMKID